MDLVANVNIKLSRQLRLCRLAGRGFPLIIALIVSMIMGSYSCRGLLAPSPHQSLDVVAVVTFRIDCFARCLDVNGDNSAQAPDSLYL